MAPISLLSAFVGTLLTFGPLHGTWTGNVDTPHGGVPLRLTVAANDSAAAYDMTFMGMAVNGSASSWRVTSDSVSFEMPFTTNMGPGEFLLRGRVSGASMSGSFVGLLNGQEMSQGTWSLRKQP